MAVENEVRIFGFILETIKLRHKPYNQQVKGYLGSGNYWKKRIALKKNQQDMEAYEETRQTDEGIPGDPMSKPALLKKFHLLVFT